MVGVSIASAVDKLEGDNQKARGEGLDELRRILTQSRGSSRLEALGDAGFHKILESLFRIVKLQKPVYLRSKAVSKNTAASRLAVAGAALRLVVEVGASKIKHKTAYAVLDHIVDTLPTSDQGLCPPLRNDYLKSFRSLLEVSSHGEHFRPKQWQSYVDFILDCLTQELEDSQDNGASASVHASSTESRNGQFLSVRTSQASGNRSGRGGDVSSSEEIILSLKLLTTVTNAPLLSRGQTILQTLTQFLGRTTRAQEPAFETINRVMTVLLTEDIRLAKETISKLVPIIRRLWSTKSSTLKDQILITLSLGDGLIQQGFNSFAIDYDSLTGLLDTLSSEYCRRSERDMLQLDDISFRALSAPACFCLRTLSCRLESSRAVSSWTTVSVITSLTIALEQRHPHTQGDSLSRTGPRKRAKTASNVENVLDRAINSSTQDRICALQVLPFLLRASETIRDRVTVSAMQIANILLEDDPLAVSWAEILLSELAASNAARDEAVKDIWERVWGLAGKTLSNSANSRAASHLLKCIWTARLIKASTRINFPDSIMFADGSSTSYPLTDASVELCVSIMTSDLFTSPDRFRSFSRKCVKWLNWQWTLPSILDRVHNAQIATYAKPDDLYRLVSAVLGQQIDLEHMSNGIIDSPIYRALSVASEGSILNHYLLGLEDREKDTDLDRRPQNNPLALGQQIFLEQQQLVLEMITSKLKAFTDSWNGFIRERSSNISQDVVQIMTTLLSVAQAVVTLDNTNSKKVGEPVSKIVDEVWDNVCAFISKQDLDHRRILWAAAAATLLQIRYRSLAEQIALGQTRAKMTISILSLMQEDMDTANSGSPSDADAMDLEESFASQSSQLITKTPESESVRHYLPYLCDSRSIGVHLASLLVMEISISKQTDSSVIEISPEVMEFVLSLNSAQLLAARISVTRLFLKGPSVTQSDAYRILEKLAEACLQDDNFERCEASLCFCLDILTSLVKLWTSADEELAAVASDIYAWFLKVMDKGFGSTNVLLKIGALLETVLEADPHFGASMSLRSPRTGLLQMLKNSDNSIKFGLAGKVSRIFDRFVLPEHSAIFDDVVDNLPSDPGSLEGMAVRLYVLGVLACKWHTVLRLAIYSIFETAARVPRSAVYARRCLANVASALSLGGPRALLMLFAPQLLYTWLDHDTIDSLPFSIFDYSDLSAMVQDLQDELVGQAAMRANTEESRQISAILSTPWSESLRNSFEKAEGYAVAKDISIPRDDDKDKSSESFIRRELGADEYLRMVRQNLPATIATLFKALGDDRGVDRSFERHSAFAAAKPIYASIFARSHSTTTLFPAAQQPSFRAKYLVDELEFLCKRIGIEASNVFSTATLVYVFRSLFDSAVPALGPLHSCAVIRKVRILVCLAGPKALSGYLLEMLLHNLRPFLTNFHCSEDTIGIFWYLVEEGTPYLKSHLPFLAGLGVCTFCELSRFVKSEQDSTTQGSHFRSTMSKGQQFHDWLTKYLSKLTSGATEDEANMRFHELIKLASSAVNCGSSIQGTPEGDLMIALLTDQSSDSSLVSETTFRTAIRIICADFEVPLRIGEDILYDRDLATRFSSVLLRLVQDSGTASQFRNWIAQTLGRAHGSIDAVEKHHPSSRHRSPPNSHASILKCLEQRLRQHDATCAGLAEQTIQVISSAMSSKERASAFGDTFDHDLLKDLAFEDFPCPKPKHSGNALHTSILKEWNSTLSLNQWTSQLSQSLCGQAPGDAVLTSLGPMLNADVSFAVQVLPFIVHLVLNLERQSQQKIRQWLSISFSEALRDASTFTTDHARVIINILLYLRQVSMPGEATMADRVGWLEVDYGWAASAASCYNMSTASLLFLELQNSQTLLQNTRSSKRSSVAKLDKLTETLPEILQSLDDPDFFYGYQEPPTMHSIAKRLAHEGLDYKNVSFHSALFDSSVKTFTEESNSSAEGTLFSALSAANLHGIAKAVQVWTGPSTSQNGSETRLDVPLNLHQWDSATEVDKFTISGTVINMFQNLASASSSAALTKIIDQAFSDSVTFMSRQSSTRLVNYRDLGGLALISDAQEVLNQKSYEELSQLCDSFANEEWNANKSFDTISPILLGREALFSSLKDNEYLRTHTNVKPYQAQLLEARVVFSSFRVAQKYQATQFCLNRAVHLSCLSDLAGSSNSGFDAAAQHSLAKTLWEQGEQSTSIQILKSLSSRADLTEQIFTLSTAEVLADLGHEVAEARLEKPAEIITNYLVPAIKALNSKTEGAEAGRAFHNFASFCDRQLQNADDLDEFARIEGIRNRKETEILDLERMIDKATGKQKENFKQHYGKAKTWFKLDDEEYRRLKSNREAFVLQALKFYLLSMKACDAYNNDVLRFLALWLDQSESPAANAQVGKYISSVPTRKFAPLMNQLSSRIMDREDDFQKLLFDLLFQICSDHPYHSLYQIFATSKSKGSSRDDVAVSRYTAATKLADHVMKHGRSGGIWIALHNSAIAFVRLANERLPEKKFKSGAKVQLRDMPAGAKLQQTIHESHEKTPPPTMQIGLRADKDYSAVPTFSTFDPHFTIAGGVSLPKIVTIVASNGVRYKMLLKGGNDDLRQDSIMEQVFEQVSNLLQDHRETRRRQLGIRTYKVIPLTPNAGIIEFVKDTIPLHEYLLPAHQRYFPKDYKPNRCRKEIADAQSKPQAQRIQAYRTVTEHFHPVMRFFFMEHFLDPDEWFQKRLAYSRSTAAISILGHVLGLGDRHGHNILLDEQTGEVVHIDLGVAFETGRVLPVPEVVPFRLTRDLVDGMGLTGVEGVFRRCCNFTLEALRYDQYSIMTILDVLRYDPLHSWSMSPLRLQKIQEEQEAAAAATAAATNESMIKTDDAGPSVSISGTGLGGTAYGGAGKKDVNEPSEADRALAVVAKKLGKSLSVEATVNELIQQATDEKNLACLYCGWAAYA